MKPFYRHPGIALCVLLLNTPAQAQENRPGAAGLFATDAVLELTLAADLETLLHDVGEERDAHPATLSYQAPDNTTITVPLKASTRGHYRRHPDHCDFPPLRLDFPTKRVEASLFAGQDKIKLVTHCRSGEAAYEQYLLQEYLVYRIYNLLTEKSFRVRLLRMTYVDTEGRRDPLTRYAFLIEDVDRLAARNQGVEHDRQDVPPEALDYEPMTLFYLFQYMIGNIDWDVPMLQNLKLIGPEKDGPLVAVPYDFDLVGLIKPGYADKAPSLGLSALRNQLFTDFCRSEDALRPALAHFNTRKAALYGLYTSFSLLDQAHVHRTLRRLDKFYRTINDPRLIEREFIRPCRVAR
jgi:hypothetical protein